MKIAVTDFDGTLAPFNTKISRETVEAIQRWRAAGNKFGIATGRALNMLNHELRHYDITTDFLICVNGAVVFDRERNILQSMRIPRPLKQKLLALPLIKDSTYPMICFCERQSFSLRTDDAYMPSEIAPLIDQTDALERDDVVQFGVKFETSDQAASARSEIERLIPELGGNPNRQFLDINVKPVDKKFGVESLLEKMNWLDCEVLAIGDDKNDLPMINAFNGFTVRRAPKFMHEAAQKVYDSVGDMLLDNL